MSVLCLCDLHGRNRGLDRLLDALRPELVLVGGDITHLGDGDAALAVLQPIIGAGVALLAVPGNMDRPEVVAALDDLGVGIHGRGRAVALPRASGEPYRFGVLGVGGSTPTPWGTPVRAWRAAGHGAAGGGVAGGAGLFTRSAGGPCAAVRHASGPRRGHSCREQRGALLRGSAPGGGEPFRAHPRVRRTATPRRDAVREPGSVSQRLLRHAGVDRARHAAGGTGPDRTVAQDSGMKPDCRKPPSMGMAAPLM